MGECVNDIERSKFIEGMKGIWNFSGESKKKIGHPAPFPAELPLSEDVSTVCFVYADMCLFSYGKLYIGKS
jgi:hypothetical protein